jgi:hypothetical protein
VRDSRQERPEAVKSSTTQMAKLPQSTALIVVDVQQALAEHNPLVLTDLLSIAGTIGVSHDAGLATCAGRNDEGL